MPDTFKQEIQDEICALHNASTGLKLMNETRVYLMTEFNQVRLALYNLEDCLFANLSNLELVDKREQNDSVGAGPDHVVTLFAFKGAKSAFIYDVSISTALELLIAFKQENLVDAGTFRDKWYGTPRRNERAQKRLLAVLERE